MTLLSRRLVVKLSILFFYGYTLLGCALLQPGYSPDSYTELLAVPLWFSSDEPPKAPEILIPEDYAGAPQVSSQPAISSKPGVQVTTKSVPDLQLQQPEFAYEEARLGIQSRLDAMESASQPGVSGTTAQPGGHGALPSDVSRASQYRKDLLATEKLKGLSTDYGNGGQQSPASLWINHAPGAYSPALRFRAPMPK